MKYQTTIQVMKWISVLLLLRPVFSFGFLVQMFSDKQITSIPGFLDQYEQLPSRILQLHIGIYVLVTLVPLSIALVFQRCDRKSLLTASCQIILFGLVLELFQVIYFFKLMKPGLISDSYDDQNFIKKRLQFKFKYTYFPAFLMMIYYYFSVCCKKLEQ